MGLLILLLLLVLLYETKVNTSAFILESRDDN
jgi:hypothetical protein